MIIIESQKQAQTLNQINLFLDSNLNNNSTTKFKINIDILLLKIPCSLASLDLENNLNEFKVNMQIKKQQYN
jgi:hypothetical protein